MITILAVVLLNAAIGFWQEFVAERMAEALPARSVAFDGDAAVDKSAGRVNMLIGLAFDGSVPGK